MKNSLFSQAFLYLNVLCFTKHAFMFEYKTCKNFVNRVNGVIRYYATVLNYNSFKTNMFMCFPLIDIKNESGIQYFK
jgi:hypothetical protein